MPVWLKQGGTGFDEDLQRLVQTRRGSPQKVDDAVKTIINAIVDRGDEALLELTRRFDRFDAGPSDLRVTAVELKVAASAASQATVEALKLAAGRIEAFHKRHLPTSDSFTDDIGATLGARWTPIDSVGLYVPGGSASYPSSVLMNAIPARIAGVKRIVMVTPATGGRINPLVLAAAELAGVDEIYRIGGAQAVAALAYGTSSIRPVDKIVGPGNAYVAEAKRQVFGRVGIDSIAGPSEVLIIADRHNNPAWIAADLLAQAEHDEDAQSILITDDEAFAHSVAAEVDALLARLDRAAIARASWNAHGVIILVSDLAGAAAICDKFAPEHLQICTANAEAILASVRHAGSIFVGATTPEAIGDYVAGPNHVLPTSRSARFSSGLSALDFMKRTTILSTPASALEKLGPGAALIADAEGLGAHALSIRIRLKP
ncbi:MAG: histidinol dehydrogenase [Micropepsaceae bacterium]